ncbi:hypothetical protein HPB52_010298 [Rhipicephalus sanguineus]|uniref:MH1 domain-containing protein n=1 Tax=Rhipicephalus sanguineus TaxID=34632 RepID=A0A9D4PQR2_RHISA|nr:hypothetical protein HPB52_010298 [Rhipicephalus sanguineus]
MQSEYPVHSSSVQQWRPCACGAVLAGGRRAPEPPPWGPAGPHWGGGDSSGEQRVPLGGLYATASWDVSALWCAFMFASKRCKLVKRLWEESRNLVVSYYASSQPPPLCAAASPAVNYEAFCSLEDRKAVESMLKLLEPPQLQTMLQAVQTKGREGCECLLLPHDDVKLPREVVAPHVLCCRLWRWPQLRHQYELKRLPWCAAASPPEVCCNPYHWSMVQKPGMPPLPISSYRERREWAVSHLGESESRIVQLSRFFGLSEDATAKGRALFATLRIIWATCLRSQAFARLTLACLDRSCLLGAGAANGHRHASKAPDCNGIRKLSWLQASSTAFANIGSALSNPHAFQLTTLLVSEDCAKIVQKGKPSPAFVLLLCVEKCVQRYEAPALE